MAEDELTVRPEVLRRVGWSLGDTGHRLANGLAGVPGLAAPAREWSTAAALATLEAAVHAWSERLGARVADTGDAVRAAAVAYESVDARAAARLSALPR
ncbi:type VII secretion target [Micromonospora sp. NPDC051296]|uniref:type VII secretion target n=1 Tax=Micromonospora sp. NPDC051296 TaxID=3155046 RepID=UPI0034158ED9